MMFMIVLTTLEILDTLGANQVTILLRDLPSKAFRFSSEWQPVTKKNLEEVDFDIQLLHVIPKYIIKYLDSLLNC